MPQQRFTPILLILLLLAGVTAPSKAAALDVPPLAGRVTDTADIISPQAERVLNDALAKLEHSDSTQIVILTIPSLEGDNLERFSIEVAEQWGIGQSKNDNGAILLVSRDDHKIRIEVGYGLEGVLTDTLSGAIIDNVIAPRFKQGDFDGGFVAGVVAMIQAVRGEYSAPQEEDGPPIALLAILMLLIPGFFIGLNAFGTRVGRRRSSLGGAALPPFIFWSGGFGNHDDTNSFGGGFGGFGGGGGGGFGGGGASGDW